MRLNRDFLILSFLILIILFSFQEGRTENKVYFSCGSDSSTNGDTLFIPCNGTHNVRIKISFVNDSSLSAITVPLINSCYGPNTFAYLDTIMNNKDSSYVGSRIVSWPVTDVNVKDITHQVLYGTAAILDPLVGVGEGLFATMIYTVKDTGRICLDTLFFPPGSALQFVSENAKGWTPTFLADTFVIAATNPNSFPTLTVPSDTTYFMCEPGTLYLMVQADDSDDGDTVILEKIEGSGTFDPDTAVMPNPITDSLCFEPDTAGTYRFVFKASDQCPAEVYDTFYVTITLNNPPVLSVPSDTSVFVCEPETLCFDVDFSDPDNPVNVGVNSPWYYQSADTSVCLFASSETSYPCTVIATDSCGVADTGTFSVTVDLNEPPLVTVPSDTSIFLCEPETLCFDIDISDPDNPGDVVVNSPWYYQSADTSVCLFASNETTYCCTVIATDSCEAAPAADTGIFCATIDLNEPPVITLPADIDTFLCDAQEICFDSLMAFDPDSGDTFIVQMVEGPGTFDPDTGVSPDTVDINHCFTPADKDSTYRFIFEVLDSCGETDRDTFNLTVDINEPPQVSAPGTLWVIKNSTKTDIITAADPDSNTVQDSAGVTLDPDCGVYSVTRISNPGGASGEWEISYEDTGCGDSVFTMIVDLRDTVAACSSKVKYDSTIVIIRSQTSYNNAPIVTVPGDAVGESPDTLELIFTAADPDSDEILDTSIVFVKPVACGSTYTERLTPSGTPSGEWKVTFYTEGCPDGVYWIDLNLRDFLGAWGWDSAKVTLQTVDVPETSSTIISDFDLSQNYPNPFNARTGITFDIPYACHVTLKIYNLTGQLVKTLVNREMYDGTHTIFWDGNNAQGESVASGIYFYKLNASDFVSIRKMILLK